MFWSSLRWVAVNVLPPSLAVIIAVWAFRDIPPTRIFVIDPLTRVVARGDTLQMRFRGVRNRACPVVSVEEIIDAAGKTFLVRAPRLGNPNRETGPFDTIVEVETPKDAAEGFATFQSVASYGVDFSRFCFISHIIGPPERPRVTFWIGDNPPEWLKPQAGR